ncbi:hypothetical protein AAFC00_005071 [Neodothiora populina]
MDNRAQPNEGQYNSPIAEREREGSISSNTIRGDTSSEHTLLVSEEDLMHNYGRSSSSSISSQLTSTTLLGRRASIDSGTAETRSYKGFPSEAAYLDALRAWAEEKKYVQPDNTSQTLIGWFGTRTLEEHSPTAGQSQKSSLLKRWRMKKEAKREERTRRKSATT